MMKPILIKFILSLSVIYLCNGLGLQCLDDIIEQEGGTWSFSSGKNVGSYATLTCSPGFEIEDINIQKKKCNEVNNYGEWQTWSQINKQSFAEPTCVEQFCIARQDGDNGVWQYMKSQPVTPAFGPNFSHLTTATLTCNTGYTLKQGTEIICYHEQPNYTPVQWINNSDGNSLTTGTTPFCEQDACSPIDISNSLYVQLTHGTVVYTDGNYVNSVASVQCDDSKRKLINPVEMTCGTSLQWSEETFGQTGITLSTCPCKDQFTGNNCEFCASGYAGDNCQYSNAVTCNGHGDVQSDGSCICSTLYTGNNCATQTNQSNNNTQTNQSNNNTQKKKTSGTRIAFLYVLVPLFGLVGLIGVSVLLSRSSLCTKSVPKKKSNEVSMTNPKHGINNESHIGNDELPSSPLLTKKSLSTLEKGSSS